MLRPRWRYYEPSLSALFGPPDNKTDILYQPLPDPSDGIPRVYLDLRPYLCPPTADKAKVNPSQDRMVTKAAEMVPTSDCKDQDLPYAEETQSEYQLVKRISPMIVESAYMGFGDNVKADQNRHSAAIQMNTPLTPNCPQVRARTQGMTESAVDGKLSEYQMVDQREPGVVKSDYMGFGYKCVVGEGPGPIQTNGQNPSLVFNKSERPVVPQSKVESVPSKEDNAGLVEMVEAGSVRSDYLMDKMKDGEESPFRKSEAIDAAAVNLHPTTLAADPLWI